jgi:uncharacterized protein
MIISRRRLIAAAGGVFAAAVGADAFAVEPARVLVSRHDLRVRGLAPDLDGLRIAHITDVHFPGNVEAAQAALLHLRREGPEIVVMTGDMTEHRDALPQVGGFAGAARGSIATVATLGNWEYACQAATTARDVYRSAGVELLVNGNREVRVGRASVVLVGFDDPVLGQPDIHRARDGLLSDGAEIWLVHAPGFMSKPPLHISTTPLLVLAGHTHGGQVRLPFVPAFTPEGSGRFVAGWYHDTLAPLYVSRGIGTTTIPVRFRCPPELPIFTLRRAEP